jgi:hypothetical protein
MKCTLVKFDCGQGFYPGGNVDIENSKEPIWINWRKILYTVELKDKRGRAYFKIQVQGETLFTLENPLDME